MAEEIGEMENVSGYLIGMNLGSYWSIFVEKQIDRKKKELGSRRPLTEGEVARLNEEFIVEYTYNSNAIEGNMLTLRETDLVLRGFTIDKKPLKDHMEAVGHKEAFEYVSELVKHNLSAMKNLFAGYINSSLDMYLKMLREDA